MVKPTEEKAGAKDDNCILIGGKPFMNYVFGVETQFRKNNEVIIKARGKFISRAVDIAEVIRKRVMVQENINLGSIKIDSTPFTSKEGKEVNVSSIEISLTRNI